MWSNEVIEDLLASVKRLNEELDSRCAFEQELVKQIGIRDSRIAQLQEHTNILNNRIDELMQTIDDYSEERKWN